MGRGHRQRRQGLTARPDVHRLGALAQLVAHLLCKQGVRGSSPLGSTARNRTSPRASGAGCFGCLRSAARVDSDAAPCPDRGLGVPDPRVWRRLELPEDCGGIGGYEELAARVRRCAAPRRLEGAAYAHDGPPVGGHLVHVDVEEANAALAIVIAEPVAITGELASWPNAAGTTGSLRRRPTARPWMSSTNGGRAQRYSVGSIGSRNPGRPLVPAERSAARPRACEERASADSGAPEIDGGITTTGQVAA